MQFINNMWDIFQTNLPSYLSGMVNTLLISLLGTIVGLLIGVVIGIIRTIPESKFGWKRVVQKVVNWVFGAYIAIFRGTPMIVQAMVIYYGTAILWGWNIQAMTAAYLIVSINTGAYLGEVIRGGINSIDEGQFDGAKSIGMTHFQTMKEVVLPQVFRNVMPSIANEFVINIKDTSVLNVISVNELFFTTNTIASNNYLFFETFMVTAIIYFILTWIVTKFLRSLEDKMAGTGSFDLVGNSGQMQIKATSAKGDM